MDKEFGEEIRKLNDAHDECLDVEKSLPNGEHNGSGATCSKRQCQPLHTARDAAQKRASEQGNQCRERVTKHIEAERRAQQLDAEKKQAGARRDQEQQVALAKRGVKPGIEGRSATPARSGPMARPDVCAGSAAVTSFDTAGHGRAPYSVSRFFGQAMGQVVRAAEGRCPVHS